jgi:hypothetical protein
MHTAYEILMMLEEQREFYLEALQENASNIDNLNTEDEFDELAELVNERFELYVRVEQLDANIRQTKFIISEGVDQ